MVTVFVPILARKNGASNNSMNFSINDVKNGQKQKIKDAYARIISIG
jgi:hypothetical protein